MAESSTDHRKKTLESELSQVSLDIQFWTQTLKSQCDITEYNQLQFADTSIVKKLLKCVRHSWEKNALNKFLEEAIGTKLKQEMEESRKKDMEDSITMLTEIKNLRDNGKNRSDEVVKDKEQQLRQCLQIPDEAWRSTCRDVSFDDVIKKLENGLGEMTEIAIQRRELSPSELISTASGGLALRGILLTNNIETSTKEIRKTVVEAPEDITLVSPISSQTDNFVEFTSQKQSDNFNRSLNILGYNIALSGKIGLCVYQVEADLNKNQNKETTSEVKSNRNEDFFIREKVECVPISSCELNKDTLQLTQSAIDDLRKIELIIEGTSDEDLIRKECNTFFESYGSHVNTGIIEFGGVYRWVATYSNEGVENKHSEKNIMNDTLNGFVSMSYTVFGSGIGYSVSGNHIKASSSTTLHYDETHLSRITMEVTKKGGPQEVTSLPLWKDGLIKNNDTWALINRETNSEKDFVGIWELILCNSASFNNRKKLSKTLRDTWHARNGQPIDDKIRDSILEFNEFLYKIKQWNSDCDFEKKIADYLRELDCEVQECCNITGESKLWVKKLQEFEPLSDFISKMLQSKDQISENNLIYVQFRLDALIKLTNGNDFPMRAELMRWMVSLKARKDKSIQSFITDNMIPKDITSFVSIIRESLRPAMDLELNTNTGTAESVYMIATNDLSKLVRKLQTKLEEDKKHHDLFFVLVVWRILRYDSQSKVHINDNNLENIVSKFETFYEEYKDHQKVGKIESLAFLISALVDSLVKMGGETSMQEEFHQIYDKVNNHLPQSINNFINKNTESPQYSWETIRSTLNDVKKGNVDLLDMELIDMIDFNETFKSDRKTEVLNKDAMPTIDLNYNKKSKIILEQLQLINYYPSKISLSDVMAVSDLPPESIAALPWRIMQKLIMLDYIGRNNEITNYSQLCKGEITDVPATEDEYSFEDIFGEEECATPNTHHPQDIFLAILSCCDLILKQTLISKMFICRLAVPFLAPELTGESMQLSLWALRSINIEWKISDAEFKDSSVVNEPLKIIAFVRLGNPSMSKSILLNHVMTDHSHHSFWNRECPLSHTERQLADGLVECQWFIPSYKKDESSALNTSDVFMDVTMFMNLRGDACIFKKQVNVMKSFANIIVCVVEISDITKSDILEFMRDLNTGPVKKILVLTNKYPESMNADMLKKQLGPHSNLLGKNIILGFKLKRVKPIVDMKSEIRIAVSKLLQNENGKVIEEMCFKQKIDGILIDENDELCKSAKVLAQEVISGMDSKSTDECKNTMLQLQGSILQEWSDLQKKKERSGRNSQKSDVIHETARIQGEMIVLRKKQLMYSLPLSKLMTYFLKNLITIVDTPTVVFFLQWVKFYLDEKSRNTLPGLRSEYQAKWSKLNDSKSECKSKIPSNLKVELLKAEKRLADASLGLEHLLREMSQIYEAAVQSNKKLNPETHANIQKLPTIAAELLIKGQPIEIMDGDTGSVPIIWLKDMLKSLKDKIGNKRLYVISVLGIQSSGKSTLMNTMFGLQFASSAGRCTRGAFVQLIKVKDDSLNYDYVLVVDTEGLRAPELGQTKHAHDNELATFVIGLGDVTIINIKGENMAEMSDVLQIAVHAFLRMKLVNQNFQLHRSCVFIHQNVPAADAKDKMQQGCQKVQEKLDQLTEEACQIENITNIHSFNEVINFDRNKHVWYFSDLWHGDPPMAPINPGYSEKAQDVKHCLLIDMPKKMSLLTLTGLIQRIEDIWGGVLSDDFVFCFRNSLAASAFHSLASRYNELKWNSEFEITEWLQTNAITQLQGCISCDSLKELSLKLQLELRNKVDGLKQTAGNELKHFFASHSLKEILIEWENQTLHRLEQDSEEYYRRAKREMIHTADSLKFDFNKQNNQKKYEEEILQKAKEFAESKKGTQVDDQQLLEMFNTVWVQWVAELTANNFDEPVNIETIVEKMLWDNLQKDSTSLKKEIETNPLNKSFHSTVLTGSISVNEIEFEHHLCVTKSLLKQAAKKVYKWATNSKDETENNLVVKKAVDIIGDIFENVEIYLNNLSKVSSRFQESHASQVIKKVIEGIDKHNKDKEQTFTILPTLKVKLAVHTSRFAITVFKKMQADYDEKNSITKKLKTYKKNILHLFKNMVKQKTNELIAADFLYGNLVVAIKKVLDKKLPLEIVKDITMHFSCTKYQLIIEILDDLAVKANFDDYKFFIHSAQDYSLRWLTNFTNKEFFVANDKGETKYIKKTQSLAYGIIDDLVKSIKSASDAEVSKKKEDQSTITWSKNFQSCLTKITIPDSELTIVSELDVIDYLNLQSLLVEKCSGMMDEVLDMFKDMKPENIKWPENTPYSQILEKLWGCPAQCPFCNEPCTDEHTTQNTNHRCIQHRPLGVSGTRWGKGAPKVGELLIESCNFNVQCNNVTFRCGVSKNECRASGKCNTTGDGYTYHNFIEYKTYLPRWDIAPSSCMDSSKYWMWFIATYKHQLTEHHNTKLPNIPDAWNQITIQQAKDSLRIYLPN